MKCSSTCVFFFFSSRRRHTRLQGDWSSDVCSSDLYRNNRAAYLTERQRQVLRSVALGYRTREIAQMLGVSVRAVHRQRERLRLALHLQRTAGLTRFPGRGGLTPGASQPPRYPGTSLTLA